MSEIISNQMSVLPNSLFLQGIKTDGLLLRKELQRNSKNIFCGPQYHIKTSSGEPMDVDVLFYDSFYPERRLRQYFLFGIHPELGIVARKNSIISFWENSTVAGGSLITAYKEKGYGTAMELVQVDILQRETNQNGELLWEITDTNNISLNARKKDVEEKSTDLTRLALQEAQEEHDRWESIYGRFRGELQPDPYKPTYVVHFKPENERGTVDDLMKSSTLERRGVLAIPTKSRFYKDDSEQEIARVKNINRILDLIDLRLEDD